MEFTIEFYETGSGRCPVPGFLDKLKDSNPDDFAAVLAGLAKPVGKDLFELRHVGKLNTRLLYFFMKGRRIILVHGLRKKTRALPVSERQVAMERKEDWLKRNTT